MSEQAAPPPSSALVFGKYEVQRRLAIGGMGEVFLARQVSGAVSGFERMVILKSLLPDLARDQKSVEEFLDEARVAATLNHPNVVSIFEVGLWDGVYYIAMEFIDGNNLAELRRMSRPGGVPPEVAARVIRDAALGLDHAHHAVDVRGQPLHIVHRDISPQNIMVRRDGVTKVVDFGIARAANRATRTATGALKGKLRYMAPEQIQGDTLDARCDQFALGVVLWELLANKRLFDAEGDLEVLKQVLHAPLPAPSTLNPGLPQELDAVVMKMLERKPDRRFGRCADVAGALDRYLETRSPGVTRERRIAEFISQVTSGRPPEPTGPSGANFVIPLQAPPPSNSPIAPLEATSPTTPSATLKRGGRGKTAGVVGAAVAVALGLAAVLWPRAQPAPKLPEPVAPAKLAADAVVVDPQPARAALRVLSPVGAKISVDGKEIGAAPCEAAGLTAGEHRVRAETQDGVSAERVVQLAAAPPAKLSVRTDPPGAALTLDGKPAGKSPAELSLPAGKHELRAELPGYRAEVVPVQTASGEAHDLVLPLAREARPTSGKPAHHASTTAQSAATASAKPAGDGFLTVQTEPWTQVSVDGQPAGTTPVFRFRVAAGKHDVLLLNEGSNIKQHRSVEVPGGETVKLNLKL